MKESEHTPIAATIFRGPPPTQPLPSATVVLVRDGPVGVEVLLLLRPAGSSFAPGHWVFPGGRVDSSDYELDHSIHAAGPPPHEWARLLEIDDVRMAAAHVVAAMRETWEETGILLVRGAHDPTLAHAARCELLGGSSALRSYLRQHGLRLATEDLRYLGRRITPEWLPLRFDTRFFLAVVESDTVCVLEGDEMVGFRWIAPAAAIEAANVGVMKMLPPTLEMLGRLVAHQSVTEIWGKFRDPVGGTPPTF